MSTATLELTEQQITNAAKRLGKVSFSKRHAGMSKKEIREQQSKIAQLPRGARLPSADIEEDS